MAELRKNEAVFFYIDDKPIGHAWVDQEGRVRFPAGFIPKDGDRLRFEQATDDDWDDFYHGYDDGAWDCELCGGDGVREYMDAPEEWGEDCPSEVNHLIPCRGCDEIARDKIRAMADFLNKRWMERNAPSAGRS